MGPLCRMRWPSASTQIRDRRASAEPQPQDGILDLRGHAAALGRSRASACPKDSGAVPFSGMAPRHMVNRTGPEFCTGVGPGVQFKKGRAGCSSSVMCEVCRFRTLRPIYFGICQVRKNCGGRSHAPRSSILRHRFRDLPGRPIDSQGATNESTAILAKPRNTAIVKFLNFPKTPIFPTYTIIPPPIPSGCHCFG